MIKTKEPVLREELRDFPLRKPADAGCRWKGISHDSFVAALEDSIVQRGWKLGDFHGTVIRNGDLMVGCLRFSIPDYPLHPAIGFLSDNGRNLGIRFYAGVIDGDYGITICRLPFVYERNQRFDIRIRFQEVMGDYWVAMRWMPDRVKMLKSPRLMMEDYEYVLLTAGRCGYMPWSRLGKVDALFEDREQKTHWGLLQDFSQIGQTNPVIWQMEWGAGIWELMMGTISD
jgi:hypothetical protein